jgi:endonuclease-3
MDRERSGRRGAAARGESARGSAILSTLAGVYAGARVALVFSNPLECLVATVLSAQCTDARVNMVTRDLFRKYRTAADYASVPREQLETEIRSTGFFRSKAKAIQEFSAAIVKDHGGSVPRTMEDLVALPGVGRKTANLVLGESFGIASGIVVDTHVHRVSRRLALTEHDDPVKIERDLMEIVPQSDWIAFGIRMIAHGRSICRARNPLCATCPFLDHCPFGQDLVAGATRRVIGKTTRRASGRTARRASGKTARRTGGARRDVEGPRRVRPRARR